MGSPHALLVGMQTGAATAENSMQFPREIKNGSAFDPAILLLGIYPKNPQIPIRKNIGPVDFRRPAAVRA